MATCTEHWLPLRQVDMSHKLTRVYDQRAGGTLTAEGPTGVVQPLPAQVQVYWARLHLAEIIRCGCAATQGLACRICVCNACTRPGASGVAAGPRGAGLRS
jgi:hypothetical protein